MEVMLLAAGIGSRLKEITKSTPKCLIEVAGRSVLEWNLLKLKTAGASSVVINLHHFPEQIKKFLSKNTNFGMNIILSEEPDLLNTGGGLKNAEPLFSLKKPILVLNADILCSVSYEKLYEQHTAKSPAATLLTKPAEEPRVLLFEKDSHRLVGWRNETSGDERVIAEQNSPVKKGFCGIQVISPVIFQYLGRPEEKRSTITAYIDAAQAGETVVEFPMNGEFWFDIGTPEQLKECRSYFEGKEVFNVKP